jgi:hypothetical protein
VGACLVSTPSSVLQKQKHLKTVLPYDQSHHWGHILKKIKSSYYGYLCIHVYRGSTHNSHATEPTEGIKKNVANTHNEVFAMKNETMLQPGKWKELEVIVLSEISQTHKYKYYMLFLIRGI